MATLLQHSAEIEAEFKAAFADKILTFRETMAISGAVVEAGRDIYAGLTDKSQFSALVAQLEAVYDFYADPSKFDIPRVPEFAEQLAVSFGRQVIRPALEKIAEALDGVQ